MASGDRPDSTGFRAERVTVHFRGRVQGVGFRYTVQDVARGFEVAGTVENLQDGRVRLVGEGDPAQLEGLVEAILSRLSRFVVSHSVQPGACTGEFGAPRRGGITIVR